MIVLFDMIHPEKSRDFIFQNPGIMINWKSRDPARAWPGQTGTDQGKSTWHYNWDSKASQPDRPRWPTWHYNWYRAVSQFLQCYHWQSPLFRRAYLLIHPCDWTPTAIDNIQSNIKSICSGSDIRVLQDLTVQAFCKWPKHKICWRST